VGSIAYLVFDIGSYIATGTTQNRPKNATGAYIGAYILSTNSNGLYNHITKQHENNTY